MSLIEAEVQPTPFSTESALYYWSEPNLQLIHFISLPTW
jgi:hypothetical protein